VALEGVRLDPPLLVQPLPSGGLILAQRRLGTAPNAAQFNRIGTLLSEFSIGDGVAEILADESGGLWVSYFDEGIWGGDPLAAAGVNCFDLATGEVRWRLGGLRGAIDAVYALNVAPNWVWAYLFPQFELVRIGRGPDVHTWSVPVEATRAIAVADETVLLAGTYDDPSAASLWQLGSKAMERGRPLRMEIDHLIDAQFSARGPMLFVASQGAYMRADITDLLT
jgi:hypothetical protein